MDEELERFKRHVNLTELAAASGYQLAPGQRATASSVAMRHPSTDDKIIVRRDADGHWTYFSVRDDRDNGSVVDFLQARRSLTLGGVRKELRAWLREERPRPPAQRLRAARISASRVRNVAPAVKSAWLESIDGAIDLSNQITGLNQTIAPRLKSEGERMWGRPRRHPGHCSRLLHTVAS
jgi:hypothetical protein